jgi:hypothetical protein
LLDAIHCEDVHVPENANDVVRLFVGERARDLRAEDLPGAAADAQFARVLLLHTRAHGVADELALLPDAAPQHAGEMQDQTGQHLDLEGLADLDLDQLDGALDEGERAPGRIRRCRRSLSGSRTPPISLPCACLLRSACRCRDAVHKPVAPGTTPHASACGAPRACEPHPYMCKDGCLPLEVLLLVLERRSLYTDHVTLKASFSESYVY